MSCRALYLYEPNLGTRPLRSSSRWWLYWRVKGRRNFFLLWQELAHAYYVVCILYGDIETYPLFFCNVDMACSM